MLHFPTIRRICWFKAVGPQLVVCIGQNMAGTAVAAYGAESFFGECIDAEYAGIYEVRWHHSWNRVTTNKKGTTGWATILQSGHAARPVGSIVRIHKCAANPCEARWPNTQYGMMGPPMHLQHVEAPVSAVAEATAGSSSTASAPPVASLHTTPSESPTPAVSPPPLPPPAAPPPEEELLEELLAPEEPASDSPPRPSSPQTAPVPALSAPAPQSPIVVSEEDDADACAIDSSAEAAHHKIQATLLALARTIRRPRSYVGYIAFILMGLLKECRPCAWEGPSSIDLLAVFAPWATEHCFKECPVQAIACVLVGQPDGCVHCAPISEEHPLERCGHYIAGTKVPVTAVAEQPNDIETLYASLGISTLATVMDGDCGLDVMTMMLAQPSSYDFRKQLRTEISEYLLSRMEEPWMLNLMVACQELQQEDVIAAQGAIGRKKPAVVAPAVAESAPVLVADESEIVPDEETCAAMRWASKLSDDANVLSLVRSLPKPIIQEQLQLYRNRKEQKPAVAAEQPIVIPKKPRYQERMLVCARFHMFCRSKGIDVEQKKLPWGVMTEFLREHVVWQAQIKRAARLAVLDWYRRWKRDAANVVATEVPAVAATSQKCLLKSKALLPAWCRTRGWGGGRSYKAPLIRQQLYEWWTGIRYAIDWKQLIQSRRSRGKKNLARFPRAIIILKTQQLLEEHAYACLLSGQRVQSFRPDSAWLARWMGEYGVSLRKANRKYQVPRHVLKERLEIFWVNLFRLRFFLLRILGYDPLILNFDQSPFHHNETGSQNKPTLSVRGSIVPIVEGNTDVKSRWTANLTTFSKFSSDGPMPFCEVMFKAASDGLVNDRLQNFLRSRGFPSWFSVTVAPKGSYREQDIIEFLTKHLEEWREGRDWRILLADDFSAHKTPNVFNLAWSRGYILLIHGGGCHSCGSNLRHRSQRTCSSRLWHSRITPLDRQDAGR